MKAAIGFAVAMGVLAVAATGSAQFIVDYWGFSDYPQTVGTTMVQVGFVTETFSPLTYDPGAFQYTYAFDGVQLAQVVPMGSSRRFVYLGGFFNIYEDASANAVYDDLNCTLSGPSTFVEGTLYLQATVDTLTWIVNSFTGRGSYTAVLTYVGGSHLGEIPVTHRAGAMFGGTTNQICTACIPAEYVHRWDGQAFAVESPTASDEDSWGGVKSLFR